jgi:hypothetical protein
MIRLLIADIESTLVTRDKVLTARARALSRMRAAPGSNSPSQSSAATGNADVDPAVGAHHLDGVHKL